MQAESDQSQFGVWSWLVRDRVWVTLLGLQLLFALPFLAPGLLPVDWHYEYHESVSDLALCVIGLWACALTVWRSTAQAEERLFWRIIGATTLTWFATEIILLAFPDFVVTMAGDAFMDCVHCAAYLLLIIAAEVQPHRVPAWTRQNAPLKVRMLGSIIFVAGLCAYFVVVPYLHGDTEQDDEWLRSFLLFLLLDAFLLVRFTWLAFSTENKRWRKLYGGFAIMMACILLGDGTEAQTDTYLEPLGLIWFGQWFVLAAVVRLGLAPEPTPQQPRTSRAASTAQILPLTEIMFVMMALLIPTIHVAAQRIGILDPNMLIMRERVAFVTLFTLGALAILQAVLLSRRNASLMADLDLAHADLAQAQKMEAVGRLAGGIAHDFNNLLTIIMGQQDQLQASMDEDDPRRKDVEEIATTCDRAAALTGQLLSFTKQRVRSVEPLNVDTVITQLDHLLRLLIGEGIELSVGQSKQEPWILGDRHQLERLLLNLVTNAREAMPDGGDLSITTRVEYLDDAQAKAFHSTAGRHVVLEVSDSGCGMSEDVKRHIFEPFFTTKERALSTGLGLATVYGIVVEQFSGHIDVESREGEGTMFSIRFKCCPSPTTAAPAPEANPTPSGSGFILLVEDEQAVRNVVKRTLIKLGFEVTDAEDGPNALKIAEQHDHIDLLVTDVVMPGMSGAELADRLKATRPDLRVLFMSGYTGDALTERGIQEDGADFIQKPFSSRELGQRVRALIDTPVT